ncbi:hypothetical protein MHF_1158 [Mycoplasma haemofelis Ohio2]|uniref:Uncharacterized protein n=1 Tax=Mycoplasma haemofelis (strain Ohio2) TaxID=859194 RepID=F6FJP5_MYCHI|nr:hypothetical protein MHF_1158 [Mycoplasma haemofelis Ohio2]
MAHFLAKLAFVSGGTAAAGGGIAAGASSIFSSQEGFVEKPKIKNQTEETSEATPVVEEPAQTSSQPSCIIWEAQDPKGTSGHRQFSVLLEKHESKEAFFQKLNDRPMQDGFKTEVENACKNAEGKKNVKGRVYVWWISGQKKWIYAGDMHTGDRDWENEISNKPSGSKRNPAA